LAKRIFRDPALTEYVNLNFHKNIDKIKKDKLLVDGAIVTDLM